MLKKLLTTVALIGALFAAIYVDSATTNIQQPGAPPEEQTFINAVTGYAAAYNQAESNEIQQDAVWKSFEAKLCSLNPVVTDWTARVNKVELANWPEYDRATFSVNIAPNVELHTSASMFGDILEENESERSLILKTSPVFDAVSKVREGDRVKFSGKINTYKNGCLFASGVTRWRKINKPGFFFRFDKVERI